jgi:hypothetical protein
MLCLQVRFQGLSQVTAQGVTCQIQARGHDL